MGDAGKDPGKYIVRVSALCQSLYPPETVRISPVIRAVGVWGFGP